MKNKKLLRIGVVCGPLHPRYGGPAAVVQNLVQATLSNSETIVFGTAKEDEREYLKATFQKVNLFNRRFPQRWFVGEGLWSSLDKWAGSLDLLHAHMLWDYPVYAAWHISRRHGLPLVVTPHGTLAEPWRWRAPHKRLYRHAISDRILRDAAAVHCVSTQEQEALRALMPTAKSVIIPNGLPESAFLQKAGREDLDYKFPKLKGRRIITYMGRLWSEKGLDILPAAWAKVHSDASAILVIAGPDYKKYQTELERVIATLGLSDRVLIAGPLYNQQKAELLAATELFVMPSRSEGLSMSLLEAAAAGVACVYTRGCNLPGLALAQGGWEVDRSIDDIAAAIDRALAMEKHQLQDVGSRAREWAKNRFSLEKVGEDIIQLYAELVKPKK